LSPTEGGPPRLGRICWTLPWPVREGFGHRTPARAASTVRLLSGYCPASPNHGRWLQTRFRRPEAVCHQVPTGTAERGHQGDQEGRL